MVSNLGAKISLIESILIKQYPRLETDKGVDLNRNGKIEGKKESNHGRTPGL